MSSVTMAEHAGFCYGVKRAVEMAEQAVTVGQAGVCHKKLEPAGDDEDDEM